MFFELRNGSPFSSNAVTHYEKSKQKFLGATKSLKGLKSVFLPFLAHFLH